MLSSQPPFYKKNYPDKYIQLNINSLNTLNKKTHKAFHFR